MCAAGVICVVVAGCMREFAATFQSSADANTFGTLFDDRGDFTFTRNSETGDLIRAEADAGTIILPTGEQDFGVQRSDGASIELQPAEAEDVLIVVRGDAEFDDIDLTVSRTALGDLANVVRMPAGADEFCAGNQDFLDGACDLTNSLDLAAIVVSITADLQMRMENAPTADQVAALLGRYLGIVSDCCLGWAEYRDNGGDACLAGG
jgi:hypothetical protein